MKKIYMTALALLAALAVVSCQKDPEVKKDDSKQNQEQNQNNNQDQNQQQGDNNGENNGGDNNGGDNNGGGDQVDDSLMATLCINEVCGVVGYKGVELYNPTDAAIDLEGVKLFKNDATEPTWTGEAGNSIPAKGFWVITSKKEFDNIAEVANAKAADSFSPSKSLLLTLKDKDDNVLDVFDRGWTKAGNTEIALPTAEGSFGRSEDAKKEWKEMSITIGATNTGAAIKGDIVDVPE